MKASITERGWIAFFICADRCRFRRNTLIECGRRRVVVATVGLFYAKPDDKKPDIIGVGRYYETHAFRATKEGPYWEADTNKSIGFDSLGEWKAPDVDLRANRMHDLMVAEMVGKLEQGKRLR